jgi:hypothetical protein
MPLTQGATSLSRTNPGFDQMNTADWAGKGHGQLIMDLEFRPVVINDMNFDPGRVDPENA